jgi:hypothetical protein
VMLGGNLAARENHGLPDYECTDTDAGP